MQKYSYNKLKGLIKEHMGTQENYAKALGISVTTLTTRFNSETYFNQREIEKTAELFGLTTDDINAVFFTK